MMKLSILTLAIFCLIDLASGFKSGAPDAACDSLRPKHHQNYNASAPLQEPTWAIQPFRIEVDREYGILSGDSIQVTIRGDLDLFAGFLMIGHRAHADVSDPMYPPERHGYFLSYHDDIHTVCYGQGITHSDSSKRGKVTFYWTAPQVYQIEHFRLTATIVKDYLTFYMGVSSQDLEVHPFYPDSSHHAKPFAAGLLLFVAMVTAFMTRN